jgi:hypothetical protein
MRIACWISRATDSHTLTHTHTITICNTYCLSTATTFARTRLSATSYVHCLSSRLCISHTVGMNRLKITYMNLVITNSCTYVEKASCSLYKLQVPSLSGYRNVARSNRVTDVGGITSLNVIKV